MKLQQNIPINCEFKSKLESCIDYSVIHTLFSPGSVKKLEMNGQVIFLWQDVKGNANYCFDLQDSEYFTTSTVKLGNILSNYFQYNFEVVNNVNESLKKVTNVASSLSKAVTNSQIYQERVAYSQQFDSGNQITEQVNIVGSNAIEPNESLILKDNTVQPMINQKQLHNDIVTLTLYQLKYNTSAYYICIEELPIVHKVVFRPDVKYAFFIEKGLNCKNSYIPSEYKIKHLYGHDLSQSFILSLIYHMAKKDLTQAMDIFVWLANGFNTLSKLPFSLVLHSKGDIYIKLFYEEIIMPLFNGDYCEQINRSDKLDEKLLAKKLGTKVVYRFENITTPDILDAPAKEFMNRLIHKDEYKLNNRNISTVANILITSTTKYIPLISEEVPCLKVEVESNAQEFCKKYNINHNYYAIANLIKYDLDNFVHILRNLNMTILNEPCNISSYSDTNKDSDILDGDVDILNVFYHAVKEMDIVFFEPIKRVSSKLHEKLIDDFEKSRIERTNLIEYFISLFGDGRYKRNQNRTLISHLKDLSSTDEPFDCEETFQDGKLVYYKLAPVFG